MSKPSPWPVAFSAEQSMHFERGIEHCPGQGVDAHIRFPKLGGLGGVAVHSSHAGLNPISLLTENRALI